MPSVSIIPTKIAMGLVKVGTGFVAVDLNSNYKDQTQIHTATHITKATISQSYKLEWFPQPKFRTLTMSHHNLHKKVQVKRSYKELLGSNCPEKTSWPELVGSTSEEAKKKIKEEMSEADIHVIPPGYFVTFDFRFQRVRIFVDESDKIIRTPTIG
ncbi:hypothetical protein PIB30_017088 [Stylosanthes scabra]|uniref:Uncharacterized protein n=1 Tax=Stylosanthes scabra TaxID=79078 RepID=A0ABU6T799_9FABA|nr:hypothetical protein [Stylosanthes scabra]